MSLYSNVQETYRVLEAVAKDRFGIGKGKIGRLFFEPHMVPLYATHRRSLEELFEMLNMNPRNSRYYLAIRQLHERGYWTDEHRKEPEGLPSLPSLEALVSDPRM